MDNAEDLLSVPPIDRSAELRLCAAVDAKAKPLGSLGRIEVLAIRLALITGALPLDLGRAALTIFAGDHGIAAEGVTAYPREVSALVAQMVLDGRAGANAAARAGGADVFLVDAGLLSPLAPHPALFEKAIGRGTRNFLEEPAMTAVELREALKAGADTAAELKCRGYGILAVGEIGIGNSSAAAAVAHCITGLSLDQLVGSGAGAPRLGLDHKRNVLRRAIRRAPVSNGLDAMREFGGFEMAMLMGALFGAARLGQVVIVDGFIATSAAAAAVAVEPNIRDYLLFGHMSPEVGHAFLLEWLDAKPLLDLGMRLGEGTGAALAIPLLRMAEGVLSFMADLPGSHPTNGLA